MYVWRKEADGTYRTFLDAYNEVLRQPSRR
jgi:hypothetical protein